MAYVEISGDFTSGSFAFEGKSDLVNGDFTPIQAINISNYKTASAVSDKGIYLVDIAGVQQFKVKILTLAGGTASVFARIISGEI